MKCYRISFAARFERIVTAASLDEAKSIAEKLRFMQAAALHELHDAQHIQCHWNTIEPLEDKHGRI